MRGMMGTRGIRVGMMEMWGTMVEMLGTGGRNERNKGKNLRLGVELINYNYGERQK